MHTGWATTISITKRGWVATGRRGSTICVTSWETAPDRHWGGDAPEYLGRTREKQKGLYGKHGPQMVNAEDQHLDNLDDALPELLSHTRRIAADANLDGCSSSMATDSGADGTVEHDDPTASFGATPWAGIRTPHVGRRWPVLRSACLVRAVRPAIFPERSMEGRHAVASTGRPGRTHAAPFQRFDDRLRYRHWSRP